MEGLLILIGIWVLDVVIKKVAASRNKRQHQPPQYQPEDDGSEYEPQDETQEQHTPRSLQDLIRQFEDAQRQATQGNIEPPTPPVQRKHSEQLTLRDIAEVVIDVDFVNLEFLMDSFDVDENTAAEMLMDLQAHHIVGHDMGEGDCDVLVHDIEELDNLLNREQRTAQKQEDSRKNEIDAEHEEARRQELERQQKLNALEERAKSARESAAAFAGEGYADSTGDSETAQMLRKPAVSTKNIADVRKGFIWAKVLDEPRFKRHWSAQYR
ncbi:MAG: hypothetical protein IKJ76_08545 [Fibrobacter sp.]|nr:hypothetical protein [Fibrobacter sp.]